MTLRLGTPFSAAVLWLTACSSGTVVGGYGFSPDLDGGGNGGKGGGAGRAGGSSNGGSAAADGATSGGTTGGDGSNGSGGGNTDAGGAGGGNDGGGTTTGHSVGEACSSAPGAACRAGLSCMSGKCAFAHQNALGEACVAAGECSTGLQCVAGTCATAGAGAEGEGCTSDVDCQAGLRCGIVGFGAACTPEGSADVGQTCASSSDCFAGLVCGAAPGTTSAVCAPIPTTGPGAGLSFGVPTPPGIDCEAPSTGKVAAYFEVPGAQGTTAGGDFFRLPFPNDARIKGGVINLDGFPTPGTTFLGYDPVKVYVDAIVANESGWGADPTVLFRFSGALDYTTIQVVNNVSPVQFLDITDPTKPQNHGAQWYAVGSRGKYICENWVGVRRPDGAPLEGGHTYTAFLTTAMHDHNGLAITRSPQLQALLASSAPTDAALSSAYTAYKPLRDYLASASIATSTVLNASVFTVGAVRDPMARLATAVQAAPVPTTSGWTKCGSAPSPCPDVTSGRDCGAQSADYDEYHALVSLPIFQKGTAPYADSGGDIDTTGPVRNENVCAALTVPKGAMPSAGWPVVVFGHGTGGSFRSHIRPEVAGVLAKAATPMAVLGFDEVEHGPRRGGSTASPNVLFFNFKNPAAARGNPLQGAADVISMGRFAASLGIGGSADGGTIKSNPASILYFGHSQGAMHGSVGLPYTNDYVATVLSGNGASLAHALLTKTSPDNIAAAVPFVLGGDVDIGNGKLFGDEYHPVLTLLDHWIGPADPLNFAVILGRSPLTGVLPKSILQPYGLGDTYSPPKTMSIYAIAAEVQVAAHDPSVTTPDSIGGSTEQPVPLAGTHAPGGHTVTLAVREYKNASGKDGHFVVFDVANANADAVRFLSMAAAGSVPQVGP